MWILVIATYLHLIQTLARRTFAHIFPPEIAVISAISVVLPAFVFKLNFTQADAPELVKGLAESVRAWSQPFDLVLQAQVVFVGLSIALTAVVATTMAQGKVGGQSGRFAGMWLIRLVSFNVSANTHLQLLAPNSHSVSTAS